MVVTIAALIITILLAFLTIFQLALVFGAPLGAFAWGGQQKVLSSRLRIGSGIAIILYAIFVVFALSKAEIVLLISNPTVLNGGLWVITGYSILGIALNAISKSKLERRVMTPVAATLAVCFLLLALA